MDLKASVNWRESRRTFVSSMWLYRAVSGNICTWAVDAPAFLHYACWFEGAKGTAHLWT